jgi:hypothetical protein
MSMARGNRSDGSISRRDLLRGAVSFLGAAGATVMVQSGMGLLSTAAAKGGPACKWPWPYEKLDPGKTAEMAYNEWFRLSCGATVINSIFSQLGEKVGEPYTSFPVEAFIFLEGGVSGWGTVCGSNAGANMVTNLIIGPRTGNSEAGMLMGSEIMQWYSDALLPIYVPKSPKVTTEVPKTISDSPLCHISVGKWMAVANKPLGSPERKERCARVSASVAYRVVEMLNAWKDGKYKSEGIFPPKMYNITAQNNCSECHGSGVPTPP